MKHFTRTLSWAIILPTLFLLVSACEQVETKVLTNSETGEQTISLKIGKDIIVMPIVAHCCDNDLDNCEVKKEACPSDKPIIVHKVKP